MRKGILITALLVVCGAARAFDAAPLLPFVTAPAVSWSPLDLDPVVWLPLDGDTTDMAGTVTAVWSGAEQYATGPWDGVQSAKFLSGAFINTQAALPFLYPYATNTWTIAAWYRVESTNRFVVCGRYNQNYSTLAGRLLGISFNRPLNATITPAINLAGGVDNTSLGLDSGAGFHHLVVAWDGTKYIVYQDSARVYEATSGIGAAANDLSAVFVVGALGLAQNLNEPRLGWLSNVVVLPRLMTSDELDALYEWRP